MSNTKYHKRNIRAAIILAIFYIIFLFTGFRTESLIGSAKQEISPKSTKDSTLVNITDYRNTLLPGENKKLFEYISSYGNNIDPDVLALRRALIEYKHRFCTDPSYIAAIIGKETRFRNIRSYSESDIYGFVQMKVGTIKYLKRLYPELPYIEDGDDFLKNVAAQVQYADYYFRFVMNYKNLNSFQENIQYLTMAYNGGVGKYYASSPSYYETVITHYNKLI